MQPIDHTDVTFSDAARSQIAELELRFGCRAEIRHGSCGVRGVAIADALGSEAMASEAISSLVDDGERVQVFARLSDEVGVESLVILHGVCVGRLQFPNGLATSSLCPTPTPDACVEFLVAISRQESVADLWAAQEACS